jgi:N-acyl-D-aspartate/D-glutamate deacylase
MRRPISLSLTLLAAILTHAPSPTVAESTTVITNARLIDGTGAPARTAHIVVQDDRIAQVIEGDLPADLKATRTIDAAGRVVAPGFIDTHAHGDPTETPAFQNFLAMGVTTIALGQDGTSTRAGEMANWMNRVEEARPGPNVMTYIGHGTVRNEAGVGLLENPSPEQITRMAELVEMAMQAGAYGMTTGLEYQPGTFSRMEELIATARPVAKHNGIVMSHMRNEDDDVLIASIRELAEQGLGAGARVHVSHIKSVYGKGANRAEEILGAMNDLRAQGVTLTADIYPYTASHTGLSLLFPDYALPPNSYEDVVANQREEIATYLRNRVNKRNGPEATLLGSGSDAGKTLAQVADERGIPFEEVLIEKGPQGGSAAYFVMDEDLQRRLFLDPLTNVCSDGAPSMRHPRGYGSYAKVIRQYVNEEGVISLEKAVHKMSGLAATTTGLIQQQRGIIAPGYAADILIFDPNQVRDTATFENPHQLAEGFDMILVNGVVVREGGTFSADRAGRMLRWGIE